jgi:hypothetical protein
VRQIATSALDCALAAGMRHRTQVDMRNAIPFALLAVLSGCNRADTVEPSRPGQQPQAAAAAEATATSMLGSAPLPHNRGSSCAGIPAETKIRVEDTSRGAALVFSTDEDIAALREQIGVRLASFSWGDAHLDNVNQGVRIVFESAEGNQRQIRASVMQRGRELTKLCGLEWNIPEDKPEPAVTASASAAPAKPEPTASNDKPSPPAPASSSPKDPKDDSKKVKPAASASTSASAKPPEPKPVLKPKDDNKPKAPPLPPPELPPPPPPPTPPKQPF